MMPANTEADFWIQVKKTNTCWIWTGSCFSNGYGRFHKSGKALKAHRFSYSITKGDIPAGKSICHQCDNPKCVRPAHLFAGTPFENMQDMIRKGRARRVNGERHGGHRLTVLDVLEIRKRHARGATATLLGVVFGVSNSQIGHIVKKRRWKNL